MRSSMNSTAFPRSPARAYLPASWKSEGSRPAGKLAGRVADGALALTERARHWWPSQLPAVSVAPEGGYETGPVEFRAQRGDVYIQAA